MILFLTFILLTSNDLSFFLGQNKMVCFVLMKIIGAFLLVTHFSSSLTTIVDIVAPGMIGLSVLSSVSLPEPAYDLAVENLNRNYPGLSFNIRYLYDKTILDCVTLQNNVFDIMAKWYYEQRDPRSVTVIVAQGKVFLTFI